MFEGRGWVALVFTLVALMVMLHQLRPASLQPQVASFGFGRSRSQADGCHHVFIDAGSNMGVHGRFLFEPEKYPDSFISKKVYDKELGDVAQRRESTCVFAFEPNPTHAAHQLETQAAYQAMGWRYYYMAMGIGRKNETINFYRNAHIGKGSKMEEWGFGSVDREHNSSKNPPVVVPVLDFAQWLQTAVFQRELPRGAPPSWGRGKVVAKIDIEGMEVALLPHMLAKGVLCEMDFVFGEVHNREKFGPYVLQNGVVIEGLEAKMWVASINKILLADGCKSTFRTIDDESYVHDGQPYPTPPQR